MGTIPTIPTFTAGAVLTAAQLNNVKAVSDFWALTPRCSVYQTTVTSVVYSVGLTAGTGLAFDTELFDIVQSGDSPMHDNSTANGRIVARTTGKYEISGQVQFANAAGGNRVAVVRLNSAGSFTGGTKLAENTQGALTNGSTSCAIPAIEYPLNAGDYIELFGAQNQTSAAALNTLGGQAFSILRCKLVGS